MGTHDKIHNWLVANGFAICQPHDPYGVYSGAGPGVKVETKRPTHLTRGPYVVRVTEDAVYEMHIRDNGYTGLLYQPWICIGTHPYENTEQLKRILTEMQPQTCWDENK